MNKSGLIVIAAAWVGATSAFAGTVDDAALTAKVKNRADPQQIREGASSGRCVERRRGAAQGRGGFLPMNWPLLPRLRPE